MRCRLGLHTRAHNGIDAYLKELDVYDECVRCGHQYKVTGPVRINLALDKQALMFTKLLSEVETPH